MNMKDFYKKYNLNKYEFASIAGVGHRSLIKYAEGETLRSSTLERIEKAISVVEKYNLVRPERIGCYFDHNYNSYHFQQVQDYIKKVKQLIQDEA